VFKRVRWLAMGMGLGVWAEHRLRRFLRQHSPPEMASRAAAHARNEWRAAVAEGRNGMREREAELRAQIDGRVAAPQ
jgi:hypothetical protein